MLDLSHYPSLGAALQDALERWADHACLIEANRDRENCRLTYRQFRQATMPIARAMQDIGFGAGDRAAILMTNQSKWLVSAYAIFHRGCILVPLDYKLSAVEHLQLLAHSNASILFIEYYLWRAILACPTFSTFRTKTIFVTEAPLGADIGSAQRWEDCNDSRVPDFLPRQRSDWACIVYSSGTGGRPKGCILTHDNYLEQCQVLTSIFAFWPGVRYLSILPTNHAIDFMVGFIGPLLSGATVVHLRTLRPEYVREAFTRFQIAYVSLVPMVLNNLERGLRERFASLPPFQNKILNLLIWMNRQLTRDKPNLDASRFLLRSIHKAFGGCLRTIFVGGAFTEPATLQFFYDLGIPVSNGYGLTEAGTALTLNDLKPFRADTVGKPLPGVDMKIIRPDQDGIGEVAVRGKTIMSQYLDNPELTAETIVDGWLITGDLGRLDKTGHLQLFGRKKNMIVTEGGKNIYPEDIESVFEGLPVKEFCILASGYIWPDKNRTSSMRERLVACLRLEEGITFTESLRNELVTRNRKLPDYKRIAGYILWDQDFPRTASLKIKRNVLAEQILALQGSESAVTEL